MACHELAALRLGLMKVLGIDDEAEKQHELKELGDRIDCEGPLKSMTNAEDLDKLRTFFSVSLVDLQEMVSKTAQDDPKLPYYNSLLVLTKKVEHELTSYYKNLEALYNDLDEVHHYLHELYPA
jgi:hypothetical protein